jgi:hypothetical protein
LLLVGHPARVFGALEQSSATFCSFLCWFQLSSCVFLLDAINRVGDEWMFSECVADRRAQFEKLEYTELDYQEELEHIEQVCVDSCSNLDSYLASFLARQ